MVQKDLADIYEADSEILNLISSGQYSKVLIWKDDEYSQQLFINMLKLHLSMDGFLCTNASESMSLLNKKVYSIKQLTEQKEDCFLIICNPREYEQARVKLNCVINSKLIASNLYNLNSLIINRRYKFIYGAGYFGKKQYEKLLKLGIDIDFFIDSDSSRIGDFYCGKRIISLVEAKKYEKHSVIIIATKSYSEICDCLQKEKMFNYFIDKELLFNQTPQYIYIGESLQWEIYDLYQITRDFKNKICVIYGSDITAFEIAYILKQLDIEIACFIDDIDIEKYINGRRVIPIEQFRYSDNILIIISSNDTTEKEKTLIKAGLKLISHYRTIRWCGLEQKSKAIRNPVLSYTYTYDIINVSKNHSLPGFTVLGNNQKDDYKIVILGNSTCDVHYFYGKSWPEFLFELYGKEKITIFCGGISGYKVQQEIIKLLKDVLFLDVNMVISYSGANNLYLEKTYPFFHKSHIELYQSLYIESDFGLPLHINNYYEYWKKYIKSMYAICKYSDIKFHAFLQPILPFKKIYQTHEKEMLKILHPVIEDHKEFFKAVSDFKRGIKKEKYSDYLHDLSKLFDDYSQIYYDVFHVNEFGNKKIAEKIFEYIHM